MATPHVTPQLKAYKLASLPPTQQPILRILLHQSLPKMRLGYGTTPAQRVVKVALARQLLAQNAALRSYTTRPTTRQLRRIRLKLRQQQMPLRCQRALRQYRTQLKHRSLPRMQKAFGITPARRVVQGVLARLSLAQNVARPWHTTKLTTSKMQNSTAGKFLVFPAVSFRLQLNSQPLHPQHPPTSFACLPIWLFYISQVARCCMVENSAAN